jgi:Ca-activated chloride channel family protein
MLRFADSYWFMGYVGLLLLIFYYVFSNKLMEKKLQRSFGPMSPFFTARFSHFKKNIKFSLMILALGFMILALARPQMGKGKRQITSQGVELMVAVDVSNSMLSEDVKPSRLEHAKKEIAHLLNILGGDKVGILAFAGSAVLLSPMTTDKSALKMFLETLSPKSVETQGTELAKALNEAYEAFKRGGEEVAPNKTMTRVVILISDGEDHEEGALKAAKDLADNGIRVFTMAFGSDGGGKIPKRDARGYLKGYVRDRSGKEVITKVNHEMMKQLARAGKGSFYHVTFGGSQMKRLKEDLDKLEKAEFDSLTSESFDEKYQLPLFFAFLFALIELFIGTRRKNLGDWKGRFSKAAVLMLFLIPQISERAQASELGDIWRNNEAVQHMQQKKMLEAHEEFTQLLSEKPFSPLFQYNMGASFMGVEEPDKAIKMFTELLKIRPLPPEVEFAAYYNLGVLNGMEGRNVEAALKNYQKALQFSPESKEIKTNIELLLAGGQGGGKGENKDQQDQQQNQEGEEQPQEPQEFTNKQPDQFKGKDMSKSDVKKILEELKKQEQRIRAKHDRKGGKEVDREKNW